MWHTYIWYLQTFWDIYANFNHINKLSLPTLSIICLHQSLFVYISLYISPYGICQDWFLICNFSFLFYLFYKCRMTDIWIFLLHAALFHHRGQSLCTAWTPVHTMLGSQVAKWCAPLTLLSWPRTMIHFNHFF